MRVCIPPPYHAQHATARPASPPNHHRPWFLQVFINVGILSAYVVGYPYEAGTESVTLLGHDVAWW